jgi:hypothetical protein
MDIWIEIMIPSPMAPLDQIEYHLMNECHRSISGSMDLLKGKSTANPWCLTSQIWGVRGCRVAALTTRRRRESRFQTPKSQDDPT